MIYTKFKLIKLVKHVAKCTVRVNSSFNFVLCCSTDIVTFFTVLIVNKLHD